MARAGGPALQTAVESLLSDTNAILIAAFEAYKACNTDTTGDYSESHGDKGSAQDQLRSAVVALTVKRSSTDRGFVASIHFARPAVLGHNYGSTSRLELRNTYPLKSLHDLRISSAGSLAAAPPKHGQQHQGSSKLQRQWSSGQQQRMIELRCASHQSLPEHRALYLMSDYQSAMFLASLVIQLLRQQDAVLPSLSGVSMERLDTWWSSNKEYVAASLTSFALEVVTPGAIVVGRGGEESIPVSDKEAGELEELLQLFELGLGESQAFATALQEEAAALEAANVFAILESGPLVEGVMGQLRHTQNILDDLDESLKVFDFKLRHMRDDIAAIEASNNSLERQARHNRELLVLLEGLLRRLHLDPGLLQQLEQPRLELHRLSSVVAAAWQLHLQRVQLSGAGAGDSLNPLLTNMRVVKEAQAQLDQITGRFTSQSVSFLLRLVTQLVGEAAAEASRLNDRAQRVCPPRRTRLHDALRRCGPLIQVIAVLDPRALHHLQHNISTEVNSLLRRDVRAAAAELRRGAAVELEASSRSGGGDYSFTKERGASTAASSKRVARVSVGSGSGGGSDSVGDWTADPADFNAGNTAGASAAKRAAFLDGSSNGLPLHEAWSQLLEGFLPFLEDEAALLSNILLMYRGDEEQLKAGPTSSVEGTSDSSTQEASSAADSLRAQHQQRQQQREASITVVIDRPPGCPLTPAGLQAIEVTMSGLEGEFMGLVDLASRSHQVLLLPLLAVTRLWQRKLSAKPHAAPLVKLLGNMAAQIQGHWSSFLATQISAVEQYEARSKMGLQQGIKHIHVLPLVSQFCLMAHDLEVAMSEGMAAIGASEQQQQQQQQVAGVQGQDQLQPGDAEEALATETAQSVRREADVLYDELCPRLLARLERIAASDAKYVDRCRLENYAFLGEALRSLATKVPALQQHWQVAESRRELALSTYVVDQLQYSKFWKLLEFAEKLDKLLQVVSPPEVSFQKDCSPAELRSLMRSTMDGTDKKLEAMVARVRKHLGGGSIFNKVWYTIKEQLIARYEHLEWLLEQCYPTTPLRPSPEELRELFKITTAG